MIIRLLWISSIILWLTWTTYTIHLYRYTLSQCNKNFTHGHHIPLFTFMSTLLKYLSYKLSILYTCTSVYFAYAKEVANNCLKYVTCDRHICSVTPTPILQEVLMIAISNLVHRSLEYAHQIKGYTNMYSTFCSHIFWFALAYFFTGLACLTFTYGRHFCSFALMSIPH